MAWFHGNVGWGDTAPAAMQATDGPREPKASVTTGRCRASLEGQLQSNSGERDPAGGRSSGELRVERALGRRPRLLLRSDQHGMLTLQDSLGPDSRITA